MVDVVRLCSEVKGKNIFLIWRYLQIRLSADARMTLGLGLGKRAGLGMKEWEYW